MPRDLGTLLAPLTSSALKPVLLVNLAFDSGNVRLWNGIGDLVVGADTYTGAGGIISASPIEGSTDLRANNLDLTLNGCDGTLSDLAMTENCQYRLAEVYISALDANDALYNVYQMFGGKMSTFSIQDDPNNNSITLQCVNELADMERPKLRLLTHEDQQIDFPGDLGLAFVPSLTDITLQWKGK